MVKADDTRVKILTAGMKLVRRRGLAAATMADVAEAAGVTRQTVYFHFRSRAGLLAAIVRHHDVTSARGRAIFAASRMPPSPEALKEFVRAWFAYLPEIFPVARELQALSGSDREVRLSWLDRQNALKAMVSTIIAGLEQEGRLRSGWRVPEAAEWVCAQLYPSQWQGLVVERRWPAAQFVERVSTAVCLALCEG